jgi:hypothetical protein
VLHLDPERELDRARRAFESHRRSKASTQSGRVDPPQICSEMQNARNEIISGKLSMRLFVSPLTTLRA